jgi:hypothetical protein
MKTIPIKASNIEDLSKQINELRDVRASQIFPKDNGSYEALVYFEPIIPQEVKNTSPTSPETPRKAINPITDKQKRLLIKAIEQKAWNGKIEDLDKMSKGKAFTIISELMGI